MATRYEVLTHTAVDGWVNCWTLDGQPQTFRTEDAAQWAIDEFFDCLAGDDMDGYSREDYRIVEVTP